MNNLENKVLEGINKIVGRPVGLNENLLEDAIDSLSLVELINMIEDLATEMQIGVDLDALISEDPLTAKIIVDKLSAKS
ncbi:MAG: hypothetical protein ACXVAX_06395 [Pseudobdellovibrio sp.]